MIDLSGEWSGSYSYPGSLNPVPFQASLRDHEGRVSGETIEPADDGLPIAEATASLIGFRQGAEVEWVKQYDRVELYPDAVHYQGTLDPDQCEIAGSWMILGDATGTFVMTRPKAATAAAEATEAAALDR